MVLRKMESNWRKILEYFSSATQIGNDCNAQGTKYISNIDYFGEPIYTYSLKEGIEDGFLAPFKVINIMTDIGEGCVRVRGSATFTVTKSRIESTPTATTTTTLSYKTALNRLPLKSRAI